MDPTCGQFRYGINPGQSATFRALGGLDFIEVGAGLSFNAFADMQLGASLLVHAGTGGFKLAYIKHKMPIMAVAEDGRKAAVDRLCRLLDENQAARYGCLVSDFSLDEQEIPLLRRVRMHTIAAPRFSEAFVHNVRSAEVQTANRGLAVVAFDPASIKCTSIDIRLSSGALVSHEDCVGSTEFEGARMCGNRAWQRPNGLSLAVATLRHARTISVCVLVDGAVKLIRCGFYDGIEALGETLRQAQAQGIALHQAVILTDGCFGINSPASLLRAYRVGGFVFCGGKANDEELLAELDTAAIGALCTKARFFFY